MDRDLAPHPDGGGEGGSSSGAESVEDVERGDLSEVENGGGGLLGLFDD